MERLRPREIAQVAVVCSIPICLGSHRMLKLMPTAVRAGMLTLLINFVSALSTSMLAQNPVGIVPKSSGFTTPTLKLGPRQLTASQLQQVQALTSAQVSQYVSAIQATLTNLRNQAANQTPTVVPNWTSLIAAVPPPPRHSVKFRRLFQC